MRRKTKNIDVEGFINKLRREDKYANPQFNKIPKYYINLDRSKDRNKHMLKQCIDYEVENIERFKAVDGKDITDKNKGEIDGIKYINDYPNCTKYELAITLSHLECMRKAGKKGVFPFIIMEDDVDFLLINRWKKNIDQVVEEIPEDCDILYLFSYNRRKYKNIITRKYFDDFGAVAYLITKKGYTKILKKLYINSAWSFQKKNKLKNIIIDNGIRKLYSEYKINPPLIIFDINYLSSTHVKINNNNILHKNIVFNIIKEYI